MRKGPSVSGHAPARLLSSNTSRNHSPTTCTGAPSMWVAWSGGRPSKAISSTPDHQLDVATFSRFGDFASVQKRSFLGRTSPHLVSGRPGYHAVLAFAIRPVAGTVARYEGIDDETTDRGIGSGCPGSGRFGRRGHRSICYSGRSGCNGELLSTSESSCELVGVQPGLRQPVRRQPV